MFSLCFVKTGYLVQKLKVGHTHRQYCALLSLIFFPRGKERRLHINHSLAQTLEVVEEDMVIT